MAPAWESILMPAWSPQADCYTGLRTITSTARAAAESTSCRLQWAQVAPGQERRFTGLAGQAATAVSRRLRSQWGRVEYSTARLSPADLERRAHIFLT